MASANINNKARELAQMCVNEGERAYSGNWTIIDEKEGVLVVAVRYNSSGNAREVMASQLKSALYAIEPGGSACPCCGGSGKA